jgi:hypothetical protein
MRGHAGEETALQPSEFLPHVDLLLQAMRINRERLNSRSKIAIDAKLLRLLIQSAVAHLPFDSEFYAKTYPDLAEATAAGKIPDLHRHFVETGFFEGRIGAPPPVDETYYVGTYPDVATAIQRGDVPSGTEHYIRSGASEGRVPNAAIKPDMDIWTSVLRVNVVADV